MSSSTVVVLFCALSAHIFLNRLHVQDPNLLQQLRKHLVLQHTRKPHKNLGVTTQYSAYMMTMQMFIIEAKRESKSAKCCYPGMRIRAELFSYFITDCVITTGDRLLHSTQSSSCLCWTGFCTFLFFCTNCYCCDSDKHSVPCVPICHTPKGASSRCSCTRQILFVG